VCGYIPVTYIYSPDADNLVVVVPVYLRWITLRTRTGYSHVELITCSTGRRYCRLRTFGYGVVGPLIGCPFEKKKKNSRLPHLGLRRCCYIAVVTDTDSVVPVIDGGAEFPYDVTVLNGDYNCWPRFPTH